MSDIIFHELHEYHREMWGFLSDNPEYLKSEWVEGFPIPQKLAELIQDHCSCFACVYAAMLKSERLNIENLCHLCPVTSWRENVGSDFETDTPCIDLMEYKDFTRYVSDENWKEAKKCAEIIMNLEWSIPEGFEI